MTKFMNSKEINGRIIVDTPGLKDSNGVVHDIVNAIGLEQAFHSAKSVRIVFLLLESVIVDPKGVDLREQIEGFLNYAPDLEPSSFLPATSVIISHPKTAKKSLIKNLKEVRKMKS